MPKRTCHFGSVHVFPSPGAPRCSVPPSGYDILYFDPVVFAARMEWCQCHAHIRVEETTVWNTESWKSALFRRTNPEAWTFSVVEPCLRRFSARHVTCDVAVVDVSTSVDPRTELTIVEDPDLTSFRAGCTRQDRHVHWYGVDRCASHDNSDPYATKVVRRLLSKC